MAVESPKTDVFGDYRLFFTRAVVKVRACTKTWCLMAARETRKARFAWLVRKFLYKVDIISHVYIDKCLDYLK